MIKRFAVSLAICIALHSGASAQSTKSALQTLTTNSFPTQSNGAVTPAIMSTWAASVINSFQQYTAVRAVTITTDTLLVSDYGQLVTYNNASPIAVTLPQALAVNSFYPWNAYACNLGAGLVTITPTLSLINGASTLALTKGQCAQIVSDGANYQIVSSGINSLTLPVSVANGGTGATSAGATAANNIGALAEANNFSDLNSPSTARTNLGLGAMAVLNSTNPGTSGNGGLSAAVSGVNVLRNSSLSAWFHGTSGTATTSAATTNWTAEGIFVIPTGANVTWAQTTTCPAGNPSYECLKITGLTSNTDIKARFVVESYSAAKIAGLATTFQFTFINNSGASITPVLSTKYPTTQDGSVTGGAAWGASTADLSATNLTPCANGSTCIEAYTLTTNVAATAGYEFVVDFGAMASNSDTITIGAGFDARATPGISTGINASPPSPEVLPPPLDIAWSQRFYTTSYGNNVASGAATHNGIVHVGTQVAGTFADAKTIYLPAQMRAAPTIAYWDGAGNASKMSTLPIDSGSTTFSDNVSNTGTGAFAISLGGFSFWGFQNVTSEISYIQYTADASLWGG